jgi:hypothetical protein
MHITRFIRFLLVLLLPLLTLPMSGSVALLTAHAAEGTQSNLTAVTGHGMGSVIVSPEAGDQGTFAAQITVNVHDASPNTTFTVTKAADNTPDGVCENTVFTTPPGPGTSFTTSAGGAGATHFERHSSSPSGYQFDIIFHVVGSDGTVLQSTCMTITVK